MQPRYILGLSFFYHDAAAVLLKDGEVVAAAQEERFSRKRHDDSYPAQAVAYVLREAGITAADLAYVAYYEKPFVHFERLLRSFIETWPWSFVSFLQALPIWIHKKLWIESYIKKQLGYKNAIYFVDHHLSHAASAFYPSLFKEAAILTMDGVGEWATTTIGAGKEGALSLKRQIVYPDSLGLFYSTFTQYLGFKPNSGEYKVMGLAPYGTPAHADKIRSLIAIHPDGSYSLDRKVFGWHLGVGGTNRALAGLFGRSARRPEDKLEQFHMDMARSLQEVLEEAVLALARAARQESGLANICLAGGVALNCVANSRLLKENIFERIFIQPAAGDAGGALGCALYLEHAVLGNPRCAAMTDVYWGPQFSAQEVEAALKEGAVPYERVPHEEVAQRTAMLLAQDKVLGWFQGRMEFGPRALGNRSIIGDPRQKENWRRINLKIKFRESFRPFAPSVIAEESARYFDCPVESPYMLLTAPVLTDSLPAVTHLDRSARLQTVSREQNPLYHDLIKKFGEETGCPVIINTSFNVRGEPIVCSPQDALRCFLATDIDYLVMGDFIIDKSLVSPALLNREHINSYELD
jgi:carbamoyltransferase